MAFLFFCRFSFLIFNRLNFSFPGFGIRPSTRFEAARGERRGNREQRSRKEEDTEVEGRKETTFYFAVSFLLSFFLVEIAHTPSGQTSEVLLWWPNCIGFGAILFETSVGSQNLRLLGFREETRVTACVACVKEERRADQRPEKGSLGEECGAVFRSAAQVRLALRWCSCAVLGAITEIWLLKKGDVLFPQQRQAPAVLQVPLCSLGRRVPHCGVRTRFPTAVSDFWCKQPQRVRASGAGVV